MSNLSKKYGETIKIDKDIKQKMQLIAAREKRTLKAVIEMACEMKINEYPTLQNPVKVMIDQQAAEAIRNPFISHE